MALHEENEHGAEHCPNCGSADIVGAHLEIELAVITQDVWCRQCGELWQDIFEYVGVRRGKQ